eukprot:17625-Heterococcus_DN1.PRE.2
MHWILFPLHILQYRDASIGVGLDSAILGDKFPQITQNALPISAEWCRYDTATTTNSNSNSISNSSTTASGISGTATATVNTEAATPQRLIRAHSRTASLSPTRHVRTRTGDQSFVVAAAASSTTINIAVALPINHLQEVRIAVQADATLQDVLLALETSVTQLGKLSVHDYTFCYTDDVSKSSSSAAAAANDDALVLTALLTAELDRLSLMDGTLRILKEQLSGGSSSSSAIVTPGVEYTRWDRLGFVMDKYNEIGMNTAVAALSQQGRTPSVRLVHRLELLLAQQNTELYGVIPEKVTNSTTAIASQQQQQQPVIPSFTTTKPAFTLSSFAFGGSDTVKKANARTRQIRLSAEGGVPKGTVVTAHTSTSSSSSNSNKTGISDSSISSYGVLFSPPSLGHVQLCARSTDSDWSEPLDARSSGLFGDSNDSSRTNSSKSSSTDDKRPRTLYGIGVHLSRGVGDFKRTAVLTFVPR